ncbi:MAG: aromatic ring-hydroxylating dioxygenase subunit alpha [Hyphomonadaceae bacterium]|nr:aromatic ring-hydroxylating dioxygenase subunit alpha [Hyphomonadaceae bacterium]
MTGDSSANSQYWTPERIRGLVDEERGWIDPRIFSEQALFDLEMERVFARSWLFLGHESQLKAPGDYINTYMGNDSVIVVRQKDGGIAAFLNMCAHRGMKLCRADFGKAKAFTCSYHGWSYDLDGDLIHVPMEKEAFHGQLDKDKWGLRRVPRLELRYGMIFGTWDENAPSLRDYLGEMDWYLGQFLDRADGGVEFVGGCHKWVIPCNWKFAAEQFGSDMYHADQTHVSVKLAHLPPDFDPSKVMFPRESTQFSAGLGHCIGFWTNHKAVADLGVLQPILGERGAAYYGGEGRQKAAARLGETRAYKIASAHATVFPNLSYLAGSHTLRVWHPRGPGEIEVWAFTVLDKGLPDGIGNDWRRGVARTFSPAGIFEQDDGENWAEIQHSLRGFKARSTRLNVEMGLGHARSDDPDFPGRTNYGYAEEGARGFYRQWASMMSGVDWPDLLRQSSAWNEAPRASHLSASADA